MPLAVQPSGVVAYELSELALLAAVVLAIHGCFARQVTWVSIKPR